MGALGAVPLAEFAAVHDAIEQFDQRNTPLTHARRQRLILPGQALLIDLAIRLPMGDRLALCVDLLHQTVKALLGFRELLRAAGDTDGRRLAQRCFILKE